MKRFTLISLGLLLVFGTLHALMANAQNNRPKSPYGGRYLYRSAAFTRLITDSQRAHVRENISPATFYGWMENKMATQENVFHAPSSGKNLMAQLVAEKAYLNKIADPEQKAKAEMETAQNLHRAIKAIIPKFNLDRGYEFTYTVTRGERQCLLQSVLLVGLMQAVGMDAGTFMVWRSISGDESNCGHVVAVVNLPNGKQVLADASDPTPFVMQKGLFVYDTVTHRYQYVDPVYAGDPPVIQNYRAQPTGKIIPNAQVRPMDYAFVRSQFYFYRGERVVGGLLAPQKQQTPAGLAQEAKYLKMAVKACPQNPLATYMLGRVYLRQKHPELARPLLVRARDMYSKFGRLPQGPKDALVELNTLLNARKVKVATR